jgi:CubicO group peptidase (beta-lactamase class C family)
VFDPIGMSASSSWAPRPANPFNTDPTGDDLWGLQLTARDMARFGLLAERDGRWGDAVVVPDGWFAEAWTPLEQNPDYGYLWWLYSRRADERVGVPEDLVAALGALDQRIYVLPSADLVVTRQGVGADGPDDAGAPFDRELLRRLDEARTG